MVLLICTDMDKYGAPSWTKRILASLYLHACINNADFIFHVVLYNVFNLGFPVCSVLVGSAMYV